MSIAGWIINWIYETFVQGSKIFPNTWKAAVIAVAIGMILHSIF